MFDFEKSKRNYILGRREYWTCALELCIPKVWILSKQFTIADYMLQHHSALHLISWCRNMEKRFFFSVLCVCVAIFWQVWFLGNKLQNLWQPATLWRCKGVKHAIYSAFWKQANQSSSIVREFWCWTGFLQIQPSQIQRA